MSDSWFPSTAELLANARVVSLPMRVRFRGVVEREALLLRGPAGWGEFAPFPEYDDAEAATWLAAAVEAAHDGWSAPLRDHVDVNATVPAVPADQVPDVLARFPGCRTVKVKVAEAGQSLDDDLARVRAVRAVAGPTANLRVDANGGWTPDQAHRALTALADVGLQYAEQPCRTVPDLVELAARLRADAVPVPLAADESIRRDADPLAIAATGAVDYAVLKVAPLGGVAPLLAIAARLAEFAVRPVISSALDTSVGIAAGVAAAAALPEPPPGCGLGTVALLAADITADPLLPVDGMLPVRRPEPDENLLDRYAASSDRVRWWHGRLTRCHALLTGRSGHEGPVEVTGHVEPGGNERDR